MQNLRAIAQQGILYLPAALILALTFSLPLLHDTYSRVYNQRIAVGQLLIIVVAFAIYRKELWQHFRLKNIDTLTIGLFFVSALISTLGANVFDHALQAYSAMVIWFAYFWLLVFTLRKHLLRSEWLLFVICVSTLIPISELLSIYFSHPTKSIYWLTNQLDFYSNIRHFGYHLTGVIICGFYFLISRPKTRLNQLFALLIIALNFFVLAWTESRQGVAISFAAMMFFWFYIRREKGMLKNFVILLLLIAAVMLIFHLSDTRPGVITRLEKSLDKANDLKSFFNARAVIWEQAYQSLSYHWFFGLGAENIKEAGIFKNFSNSLVQPHSIIFQALTSWGLIGLNLLILIFIRLFYHAAQSIRAFKTTTIPAEIVIGVSLCGCILLNALIDGTLYHVLPITLFICAAAIFIGYPRLAPEVTEGKINASEPMPLI